MRDDPLGFHARSVQAKATRRRNLAARLLVGLRFVPQKPYRVEEFTGGIIDQRDPANANTATDYHIVDARGRAVFVVSCWWRKAGSSKRQRRARAEWYVEELNAL